VIEKLMPLAYEGLERIGIDSAETSRYLGVIEQRLARRQTGAIWQQKKLAQLKQGLPSETALHALLEEIIGPARITGGNYRSQRS
jgi:hypothetical protein